MKNKKGSITLFIVFLISAFSILIIASVFAPMGVRATTKFYEMGEKQVLNAQDDLNGINNTDIKTELNATFNNALGAVQNNIEINSMLFQYGWIFVIILSGLIIFLFTRRLVEYGGVV
jgi:hypothetical protein